MTVAFEVSVFEQLIEDLGSRPAATTFLDSFTNMLDERITLIERALRAGERDHIVTALHSLRASAAMVGATQLNASTTAAIEDHAPGTTAIGPFIRKLQGQADFFRTASASFRTPNNSFAPDLRTQRHS
jgi:hypothetical protein